MVSTVYEGGSIAIIDDEGEAPARGDRLPVWRVLIADDDREVHEATVFALSNSAIEGRRLEFLHAYSALEAEAVLERETDIAVVLLDVVMEREDAGLQLVRRIRDDLGLDDVRIILRTGQPGYAPELKIIREYDINDYKTKSELTLTRLTTALTAAIRSYRQIRTIAAGRLGLERIVDSAADLFSRRGLQRFGEGVLNQIFSLTGCAPEGFLCVWEQSWSSPLITHTAGAYNAWRECRLDDVDQPAAPAMIRDCFAQGRNRYTDQAAVIYVAGSPARRAAVYLATARPLGELERKLLDVFSVNVSVGLENVNLFQYLDFHAYYDALTALPNRSKFIAEIAACTPGEHDAGAVMLIDIDHFSEINDALGHRYGDRLLVAVAERLRGPATRGLCVARVGADVFGVFGPLAMLDPGKMLALLTRPFAVDGYALSVTATIGLAELAVARRDEGGAMRAATIALNLAKRERRGSSQVYDRSMATERRGRLALLNDLRAAIGGRRGLELHYQPQVDLRDGSLLGAEALLRWRRNDGSLIPPENFVALAEYSGLMVELGAWVLATAMAQLRAWQAGGLNLTRMSVNVSMAQFRDPGFVPMLQRGVEQAGVSAAHLEIEITESMAMLDTDQVTRALAAIRALGVTVAIDDFGTGFSSLAYLHHLPIDRLKVDRSFVRTLTERSAGRSIAATVIGLGKTLGLGVIAEGVETAEQANLLREMGCVEAQGFHYARPMPPADFEAWVAAP